MYASEMSHEGYCIYPYEVSMKICIKGTMALMENLVLLWLKDLPIIRDRFKKK